MRTRLSLTLEDANRAVEACFAAARAAGRSVSIAVTDDAGGLLAFQRMDGARVHTIDFAIRKARASAMVGAPTAMIEAMSRDRPSQAGDMAVGQGGLPMLHQGQCVGAVGVSGALPEQDEAIARAGLAGIEALEGVAPPAT